MSKTVLVKEERASPVPNTSDFTEDTEIRIKLEPCEESQNSVDDAILPDVTVKLEPLDYQTYAGQNESSSIKNFEYFDNRMEKRTPRVSEIQWNILLKFLENNNNLVRGYNNSARGRAESVRLWEEVADLLNVEMSGTYKSPKDWSIYVSNFKSKLKKMVADTNMETNAGGGTPRSSLSDLENRFLAIIGPGFGQTAARVSAEPYPDADQLPSTSHTPPALSVSAEDAQYKKTSKNKDALSLNTNGRSKIPTVGKSLPNKALPMPKVGARPSRPMPRHRQTRYRGAISEHFLAFSSKNKHNCQICFKSFANNANLQRHTLIHNRVKLHCNICNKQYFSQEQLEKHLDKHDVNKRYPCEVCGKKFKTTSNLMQHKRVHMTERPHKCGICQRGFAIRANLLRHQGKSRCKPVSDDPLICKVCNKVFQKTFLLKSHLRKHDTDKPFICDMCGLDFKYKSAIIRHMAWHTGFRPYKCPFCSKRFTHSGLIKPHLRTHTGEKPYQCSICLKLFTHKHNMERHKINHGRIKRLVCDICNKKFPRESRLIYHMKTHTSEKFFDCGKCDKKFTHKSNVIRHYERKHPGFKYNGTDTDASVAMKVWDKVKGMLHPHYDIYQQPEEILG